MLLYIYYAVLAFLCPITVYIETQRLINLPHYCTTLKKQKMTADTVVDNVAALRFLCVAPPGLKGVSQNLRKVSYDWLRRRSGGQGSFGSASRTQCVITVPSDRSTGNWETPAEVEESVRYHSMNSAWRR